MSSKLQLLTVSPIVPPTYNTNSLLLAIAIFSVHFKPPSAVSLLFSSQATAQVLGYSYSSIPLSDISFYFSTVLLCNKQPQT